MSSETQMLTSQPSETVIFCKMSNPKAITLSDAAQLEAEAAAERTAAAELETEAACAERSTAAELETEAAAERSAAEKLETEAVAAERRSIGRQCREISRRLTEGLRKAADISQQLAHSVTLGAEPSEGGLPLEMPVRITEEAETSVADEAAETSVADEAAETSVSDEATEVAEDVQSETTAVEADADETAVETGSVTDETEADCDETAVETETVADETAVETESDADETAVETESVADETAVETESAAEEVETESEAEEDDAESEEDDAESEEEDAESEAEVEVKITKPAGTSNNPDAETLNQLRLKDEKSQRLKDLEAGWVGIGSSKDCHPLDHVENNRVVIRRSQRITRKISYRPPRRISKH